MHLPPWLDEQPYSIFPQYIFHVFFFLLKYLKIKMKNKLLATLSCWTGYNHRIFFCPDQDFRILFLLVNISQGLSVLPFFAYHELAGRGLLPRLYLDFFALLSCWRLFVGLFVGTLYMVLPCWSWGQAGLKPFFRVCVTSPAKTWVCK